MGARWYDPSIGVWTQPDSIVPNPIDPLALNRYSFVEGNPLKYTDPSGRGAQDIEECGCAGMGSGGYEGQKIADDIVTPAVETIEAEIASVEDPLLATASQELVQPT